jgi:serine/threonine-protein kinase RsbW
LAPARIQVSIPSDFTAARGVQERICKEVQNHGFAAEAVFAVRLALEEAMINAIKHGNKLDPAKQVHINATIDSTQAEITIEDEGPGFKRKKVPDPTRRENLEKCSGRGILLMESYMNSVSWSKNGRMVRMVKRNEAGTPLNR